MLGDDLEGLAGGELQGRSSFKNCALIAGLIERRFPGHEKSGRQVTFSSDLVYDVLRRHPARPPAAPLRAGGRGQRHARRGAPSATPWPASGAGIRHSRRRFDPRLALRYVPVLLSLGQERVPGAAMDWVLEEAEDELIAEAMA